MRFSAISVFRCILSALALLALVVTIAGTAAIGASAEDASPANRMFVRALQFVDKANSTLDMEEENRLLHEADKLFSEIISKYPDSAIAVQLATSQFIGDFDYIEFQRRLKNLVCNAPTSSACFLHRIETLLPPVEMPITAARWDWLSLAVAYNLTGDPNRGQEIIAPFVAAVKRGAAADSEAQDLFVARALSLMGHMPEALEITRSINDCSTRIYNLTDLSKAAHWNNDADTATGLAEEAAQYANTNTCKWEAGLVIQALNRVGKTAEAKALLKTAVDEQFNHASKDDKTDCCSPDLALAAADLAEPNLAINILRAVQDDNPWVVPGVLGRLARRGEATVAQTYAEQVRDVDLRGESFTQLIDADLSRKDRRGAEELYHRLALMTEDAQGRRPGLLAQKARALHLLYNDERWRQSFVASLNAAERASNFARRDIGAPLLAIFVEINTGHPMLD